MADEPSTPGPFPASMQEFMNQAQLAAFDEQLAALENFLGPMAQWSRSWAEVEQRFPGRKPEGGR